MRSTGDDPAEYEVVLPGAPGPAVLNALAPYVTAATEVRAVVRAPEARSSAEQSTDILDLLERAEKAGLQVSRIARLR